jgi:hypothetical protein
LSSHRDGFKKIRYLLTKKNSRKGRDTGDRIKPNSLQVYAWQLPVVFLTAATVSMIVGMFLHVWAATRLLDPQDWWGPDSKVSSYNLSSDVMVT